jgi:hypothetical protein
MEGSLNGTRAIKIYEVMLQSIVTVFCRNCSLDTNITPDLKASSVNHHEILKPTM